MSCRVLCLARAAFRGAVCLSLQLGACFVFFPWCSENAIVASVALARVVQLLRVFIYFGTLFFFDGQKRGLASV